MNFYDLEQQLDLDEEANRDEQTRGYDRIACAAIIIWLCVFACGATVAMVWFLATD